MAISPRTTVSHAKKVITASKKIVCSPITHKEMISFARKWIELVENRGTYQEKCDMFLCNPGLYLYTGQFINLKQHDKLHSNLQNENIELGEFHLMPLSDSPARCIVKGTAYWEAQYKDSKEWLRAVCGQKWILEKCPDGQIKFMLCQNTFMHTLPDSAEFRWEIE